MSQFWLRSLQEHLDRWLPLLKTLQGILEHSPQLGFCISAHFRSLASHTVRIKWQPREGLWRNPSPTILFFKAWINIILGVNHVQHKSLSLFDCLSLVLHTNSCSVSQRHLTKLYLDAVGHICLLYQELLCFSNSQQSPLVCDLSWLLSPVWFNKSYYRSSLTDWWEEQAKSV